MWRLLHASDVARCRAKISTSGLVSTEKIPAFAKNQSDSEEPLGEKKRQKDLTRVFFPPQDEKKDECGPDGKKQKGPPHVKVEEGPEAMQQPASRTWDAKE